MFVIVNTVPPGKRGFFARRRYKKQGCPPEIRRVDTPFTHYFVFDIESRRGGINWQTVRLATGRRDGVVLLSRGFVLPEHSGLTVFDSRQYRTALLINGFFHLMEHRISENQIPAFDSQTLDFDPQRSALTLIDIDGRCLDEAERMLKLAGTVFVVTAAAEKYRRFNDLLGATIGAELIIRGDTGCIGHSAAVLAPFGLERAGNIVCHPLLFAPDLPDALDVDARCVSLPRKYMEYLPKGIAPDVFAAALFEQAGLTELGRLPPRGFVRFGRFMPLGSPVP